MANKKISELTPKLAQLEDSDLVMVSDYNGATYDTKSITGANIRPFKTVMFNISQTGTSDPTVNYSYTDEVTQTFTFSRLSVGNYRLTSSSALFTASKTFCQITLGTSILDLSAGVVVTSTTQLDITNCTASTVADSLLTNASLEIKIIK
jgi:hypothetical protein